MRAIEISQPGPPDVLRVVERETPVPEHGQVLVAVRAAGIARADAMQRQGKYPPPPGAPDIPGLEVSGTIAAVGNGVTDWREGDAVCALLPGGGYAEYAIAPAGQVLAIPENWNFAEAAALPENMFTVYDNLFRRACLREGESVLIHGGSSGIGTTAIMLAKAFGARFIASTAGSAEKCDACRKLGADLAIDYKSEDFVEVVRGATQGRGIDAVLDIVGGDYIPRDVEALAPDGRIVCIATSRGRTTELDIGKMMQKRATFMATALRSRSDAQKAAIAADLRERVWPLLPKRDPVRPVVDSTFTFEQAARAHERLESSAHIGKIVLTPE